MYQTQDIIEQVRGLTQQELVLYQQNFEMRKKSKGLAWFLCVCGGSVGAHLFYTGRYDKGIIYCVVFGISLLLVSAEEVFGSLLFLGLLFAIIYDMFTMNSYLIKYHKKEMQEVLAEFNLNSKADKFLYQEKEWLGSAS